MEYVDGESLAARLQRERRLSPQNALRIGVQVARALESAAHLRLIHRDIKPANILIQRNGTAKVTDFGIAKPEDGTSLGTGDAVIGTIKYMAPEVLNPEGFGRILDSRADIYALGLVIYEMIAGRTPFEGNVPEVISKQLHEAPPGLRQSVPALDPRVEQLIMRCLAKEPQYRPQTALELRRDLERLDPTLVDEQTLHVSRRRARRRWLAQLSAATLTAVAVVGAVVLGKPLLGLSEPPLNAPERVSAYLARLPGPVREAVQAEPWFVDGVNYQEAQIIAFLSDAATSDGRDAKKPQITQYFGDSREHSGFTEQDLMWVLRNRTWAFVPRGRGEDYLVVVTSDGTVSEREVLDSLALLPPRLARVSGFIGSDFSGPYLHVTFSRTGGGLLFWYNAANYYTRSPDNDNMTGFILTLQRIADSRTYPFWFVNGLAELASFYVAAGEPPLFREFGREEKLRLEEPFGPVNGRTINQATSSAIFMRDLYARLGEQTLSDILGEAMDRSRTGAQILDIVIRWTPAEHKSVVGTLIAASFEGYSPSDPAAGTTLQAGSDFRNRAISYNFTRAADQVLATNSGSYVGQEFVLPPPSDPAIGYPAQASAVTTLGTMRDAVITVDGMITQGDVNRWVVVGCRRQEAAGNYYRFMLNPYDRRYSLELATGRQGAFVTRVLASGQVPSTNRLNYNKVELSCKGDTLTASVNGSEVANAKDSTFSGGHLFIGIVADVAARSGEARFTNLVVTR